MSDKWLDTPWQCTTVTGQQEHDNGFPLVLLGDSAGLNELLAGLGSHRQTLLMALASHGGLLFRDFGLSTDRDFDAFITAFDLPNFAYRDSLSNAVRHNRTERVFTANEAPPTVEIYLHHEMAQTPLYPSRLFFFCERAADHGGATPLCRSDVLLNRLARELPDFLDKARQTGARYTNTMPAEADSHSGQGRSWQDTLNASNRSQAEQRLHALGYEWEWHADDSLRVTSPALPVVRKLDHGREVFFNQLIAAFCGWQDARNQPRKSIRFGDDSEIPEADMARVAELAYELVFDLPWQHGDVALVDNFLVMHGRRPFQGQRQVLASLVG